MQGTAIGRVKGVPWLPFMAGLSPPGGRITRGFSASLGGISRGHLMANPSSCRERERRWNANIHYYPLLLEAIPRGARRVLDVGCGDGLLSAQLAQAGVRHVVGLDLDAAVLDRARARHGDRVIEWVRGDVFAVPFEHGSFDAVVAAATLHHVDAEEGLLRFADLVRPGGVVAVLGLAANDWWDWPYAAVAGGARTAIGLVRGYWEHSAPLAWPPPETYRELKKISNRVLPGCRYHRLLLGRYLLIWTKPEW
jgi:SAM-dependent methyltransferase